MSTGYGALCTDFFIETKLNLKLGLPSDRDTLLSFFDRVRKLDPALNSFNRFEEELVLERVPGEGMGSPQGVAMRQNELRAWIANPATMQKALDWHRQLLDIAPHFLSLSPLDVDSLEMAFVFEMEAEGDHDQIIQQALYGDSPIADIMSQMSVIEHSPIFTLSLNHAGTMQATIELRPRRKSRQGEAAQFQGDPLLMILTVRQLGPFDSNEHLQKTLPLLLQHADQVAGDHLIPQLLIPISRIIANRGC